MLIFSNCLDENNIWRVTDYVTGLRFQLSYYLDPSPRIEHVYCKALKKRLVSLYGWRKTCRLSMFVKSFIFRVLEVVGVPYLSVCPLFIVDIARNRFYTIKSLNTKI